MTRPDRAERDAATIAGMRDRVIHQYDTVDLEEVWRTVTTDLPALLRDLAPETADAEATTPGLALDADHALPDGGMP